MDDSTKVDIKDIYQIPNLISLFRILLTPFIGYFLWLGDDKSTVISVVLLAAAGLSDYLDGLLARKLDKITKLGLILDPLADKAFVSILIVELIFLRNFPVWLAIPILLRDIIILLGASRLMKRKGVIPVSIISGKYYFASTAVLIISYVIRFPFGEQLFVYLTAILLAVSSFEYGRLFHLLSLGKKIPLVPGRLLYKCIRTVLMAVIAVIYLYHLYGHFMSP